MSSHKTKIVAFIASAVLLASSAVFVVSCIVTMNLGNALHAKQEEQQQAQAHSQQLSELTQLVEKTTDERTELSSYFLTKDHMIDFLTLVEKLGREQGVELKTKSLTVVPLDDTFSELHVSVLTTGPYDAIARVLAILETLPYQSRVANATLSRLPSATNATSTNTWSGTFDLRVTTLQ